MNMKIAIIPHTHNIADTDESVAPGHAAWKRVKVERGPEQANDRVSLIPADKVWRDLGLEG